MDRYPMTQEGHQALTAELKLLQTVERPKISKEIGVAREHAFGNTAQLRRDAGEDATETRWVAGVRIWF